MVYRFDDEHLLVQLWDPADALPEGFGIAAYHNAPSFKTLKVNLQTGAAESLAAFPESTRGGDAEIILDGVTYFQDVVGNRGTDNGVPTVIMHELAHAVSAWFMPPQPSWFAEGFAGVPGEHDV